MKGGKNQRVPMQQWRHVLWGLLMDLKRDSEKCKVTVTDGKDRYLVKDQIAIDRGVISIMKKKKEDQQEIKPLIRFLASSSGFQEEDVILKLIIPVDFHMISMSRRDGRVLHLAQVTLVTGQEHLIEIKVMIGGAEV